MLERSIFIAALEKEDATERNAYLDQACGDDVHLRERIDKMLAAHVEAGGILDCPAVARAEQPLSEQLAPTLPPTATEHPGARIGPYKLLQQIGEGGMGTVWMAEQTEPVRRKVALKIIKPGMDSSQVIARFEAERQALAVMDHPNIAKVLDAGTSETGRPYFVMELVKGTPITQYCDEHRLPLSERLQLFVGVCQALQHAHQKAIIHRDIKPSNVLVAPYDGRPVVKVIDFGVAKAMGQRLTERTMFTEFGAIVGTLQYMSPEQAELNNQDIDTRSDIYSLGVLLYELLTGTTPLDMNRLRGAALASVLMAINEEEPPKPSTRLSQSKESLPSVAARRQTDPVKLPKLVRGDLDWIVMKALEKDRSRRYETAVGLARDVERFLRDEPVEACPPSVTYRLRKTLRRHRRAAVVAASLSLLVTVMLVNHFVGYVRLKEARGRAAAALNSATIAAAEAKDERDRALAAEARASDAATDAERAEREAKKERDRALAAEQQALKQRELETLARLRATEALARSQFDQAHSVRLAGLPGRRWRALDLIHRADTLRAEAGAIADAVATAGERAASEPEPSTLPSKGELRSEAIASLLLRDGRVAHTYPGFTHAVSPDGRFAASAVTGSETQPGAVKIIDLETGAIVQNWEGKEAHPVIGLVMALGPHARFLAVVSINQKQITVWDVAERKAIRVMDTPRGASPAPPPVRNLAFSPDGKWLAAVVPGMVGDATVMLWSEDRAEGQALMDVTGVPLASVTFSPDSRLLAFASNTQRVTLWNIGENRVEREIELPIATDGAVGFDPSGQRIAIHGRADAKSQVLFWDLALDRAIARLDTGDLTAITPIAFAPGGRRIAVSGLNRMILAIDVPSDDDPVETPLRLNHGLLPQMIAWTSGGELLSGGLDGLKRWEFASADAIATLRLETTNAPQGVSRLAFSPDGEWVAAEAWPGRDVEVFDARSGKRRSTFRATTEVGSVGLRFSLDGQRLMRFSQSGLIVWNLSGADASGELGTPERITIQHISSIGTNADGGLIVTSSPMGGAFDVQDLGSGKSLWKADERKLGTVVQVSSNAQFAVAYQAFAVGKVDRPIRVWDLETNRQRFEIPSPRGDSFQTLVELSPDGRWIAVLHFGGDVARSFPRGSPDQRYVHESVSGSPRMFTGPAGLTFGPAITAMVHPNEPWFGEIWNAETGERQSSVAGPVNIESYAFSPDGRYFAASMRGGLVRVWNVPAREELFDWHPPIRTEDAKAGHRQVAFANQWTLAIPDSTSPTLHLLDLEKLNAQLAARSLGW